MKPKTMPDNLKGKVSSPSSKETEKEANFLLYQLFIIYDKKFFFSKLKENATVRWSKRMTMCAGCTQEPYNEKLCDIALSRPLMELRPLEDLMETLLHEMIHAYLWLINCDDEEEHGPNFFAEMERVGKLAGMKLEVYHDFIEECYSLQCHVWKCNGPCRKIKGERSVVRRTMNRPPTTKEKWVCEHFKVCTGTFIKIREPQARKQDFDLRIDNELRIYLPWISKTSIEEVKNGPTTPSENIFPHQSNHSNFDGMNLECHKLESESELSSANEISDEENLSTKTTAEIGLPVTPPMENKSKAIATPAKAIATPARSLTPPTEDKPKTKTGTKSVTPPSKNISTKTAETSTRMPLNKTFLISSDKEESAEIIVTPVTPPMENKSKAIANQPKLLTPPTEDKPKTKTGAKSVKPPSKNISEAIATLVKLFTPPTEDKLKNGSASPSENTSINNYNHFDITLECFSNSDSKSSDEECVSISSDEEESAKAIANQPKLLAPPTEDKPKTETEVKSVTPPSKNISEPIETQPKSFTPPTKDKPKTKTGAESVTPPSKNTSNGISKESKKSTKTTKTKTGAKSITPPSENISTKTTKTSTKTPLKKTSTKNTESSPKTSVKKKKSPTNKKSTPDTTEKIKYKWQCSGKCQNEAPMFGRIERLINRPPNKTEKWFLVHEKNCGGVFLRLD